MNSSLNKDAGGAGWPAPLVTFLDQITRVSLYGSCMALFLMLACYVFEVIMRYFFNSPTSWSNDCIQLLFAAMIMLAAPEVTRLKGHIVISFFLEKMKPSSLEKVQKWLALTGGLMCFFAAYICLGESMRQYHQNIETLWNTPIPKWWISGFLPYGFTLSGLQFIRTDLMGTNN